MTTETFSKKVRTRFAPSPTGEIHVGSVRTALYNYLFARNQGGDFLLRLEDTDRNRLVPGAAENLVKVFNELGLHADEGILLDQAGQQIIQQGNSGPYIQSERLETYQTQIQKLLETGYAYYCFCASERLESLRQTQQAQKLAPRYDRHCLTLSDEEVKNRIERGEKFVIRFKTPSTGITEIDDLVYGKIKIQNETLDDFVLLKSDGYPTYHYANVVDDYLMQISHVIRGEEWLPSTPKHILLYQAFNWEAPRFAHLPLLLNANKSKLSKRQGDVSTQSFLDRGYLPEALLNFLLLLGWNPKTEEEIFSLEEMEKRFNLEGLNKYGAIFNLEKLDWMNGVYIRNLTLEKFAELSVPYLEKDGLVKQENSQLQNILTGETLEKEKLYTILALEKERIKKLSEISDAIHFMLEKDLIFQKELLAWKKMSVETAQTNLRLICEKWQSIKEEDFKLDQLSDSINQLKEEHALTTGELMWPLRVALSGRQKSPGPFEIAEVLGKKFSLERITRALNL